MMHRRRRWVLSSVRTAEELAEKLTKHTSPLCTGFYVASHPHYLFLNDATHEDNAAEFAAVSGGMAGPHVQIESITFSWCSLEKALEYIRQILAGNDDASDFAHPLDLTGKLDTPEEHERCPLCA